MSDIGERIIFSSVLNGTETLRTLALHGVNTIGLRIMGAAELARTALMRSGIVCTEEFLPRKDEAALIDTFIRQTKYFESASFADAENMASALFSLRSLIPQDEAKDIHGKFCGGEFADKNKAIAEVYDRYIAALKERVLIDTIGLIRKAISEADRLNCEIITLQEFELSPLEQALAGKLAANGSKVKTIPITELFGTSDKAGIRDISYLESYGAANEVETILSNIAESKLPFDGCTVAIAETSRYAQLFYEYSQTHGIDITFGCGIPITNSYPARLLRALFTWDTTGFHGLDALKAVLFGESVDRTKLMEAIGTEKYDDLNCIAEILGNLKCDRDRKKTDAKIADLKPILETWMKEHENGVKDHSYYSVSNKLRLIDAASKLGEELSKGYSSFIKKFANIRKEPAGRIDRAAVNVICNAIDAYVEFSGKTDIGELIPEILNKTVCSEPAKEGALYVTSLNGAFSALRRNLFVVGLSADNYPGKHSENYLILDSDYEMFGNDMPTSVNRIKAKVRGLKDLLRLAGSLGITVQLSYSSYNAAETRESNPSSVLFEIYREEHGEGSGTDDLKKAFKHTGYFKCKAAPADAIGQAYTDGHALSHEQAEPEAEAFEVALAEKGYAPTKLESFFGCPRSFLLGQVLGIEDEEATDPFSIIDNKQFGTLAHSIMEWLASLEKRPGRNEFLDRAGAAFDDFMKEYVPLNKEDAKREKQRFIDVMGNAYDLDPDNEVLSAEEKKTVTHESGIKVYGYPDRVEKDKDGNYLIADFKTGRTVEHVKDDIDSCLQVVIYAYMMDRLGTPISYGEYRYLRKRKTIPCVFDDDMKQKLSDRLTKFKSAMKAGDFPVNPGADNANCEYCKLADICGRDNEKEV